MVHPNGQYTQKEVNRIEMNFGGATWSGIQFSTWYIISKCSINMRSSYYEACSSMVSIFLVPSTTLKIIDTCSVQCQARPCRQQTPKHLVWWSEHLSSAWPQQHPVNSPCLSFLLCDRRIIIYTQNPHEESLSYSIWEILETAQHIVNIQVLGITCILIIYLQPSYICHGFLCIT